MKKTSYIEALLFAKGEPMKLKEISKTLSVNTDDLEGLIKELEVELSDRGIRLMRKDDSVLLTTAPEASEILQGFAQEDLNKEIGKAGMEVLTIILYASPINRRYIDYIRGVNSSSVLRSLVLKGMVERRRAKSGQSFEYTPTADLLAFLGLSKLEDLVNYYEIRSKFIELLESSEGGSAKIE
ncbi:MAG: SMC-Scp complex subunit ScpB [Candidatus Paceibacterota bacterium]